MQVSNHSRCQRRTGRLVLCALDFSDVVATLAVLQLILQSAGRMEQDSKSYPLPDCAENLGSNSVELCTLHYIT